MINKPIRLFIDMSAAYVIVYWIFFSGGVFYYPESEKWILTVILLALSSGVLISTLGYLSVYLTEVFLKYDPKSGPYLIGAYAISSAIGFFVLNNIASQVMNFYIINNISFYLVFLLIFCPALTIIFFWRANSYSG